MQKGAEDETLFLKFRKFMEQENVSKDKQDSSTDKALYNKFLIFMNKINHDDKEIDHDDKENKPCENPCAAEQSCVNPCASTENTPCENPCAASQSCDDPCASTENTPCENPCAASQSCDDPCATKDTENDTENDTQNDTQNATENDTNNDKPCENPCATSQSCENPCAENQSCENPCAASQSCENPCASTETNQQQEPCAKLSCAENSEVSDASHVQNCHVQNAEKSPEGYMSNNYTPAGEQLKNTWENAKKKWEEAQKKEEEVHKSEEEIAREKEEAQKKEEEAKRTQEAEEAIDAKVQEQKELTDLYESLTKEKEDGTEEEQEAFRRWLVSDEKLAMERVMMCALTVQQKIQKLHQLHAQWCKKDARPVPKANKIVVPEKVGEQKGGAFGGGKRSGGKNYYDDDNDSDDYKDDRLHFYEESSTDEETREVVNGINFITPANEPTEIVNVSSEDEDSVPSNDPNGSEASDPSGSQFLDPSGSQFLDPLGSQFLDPSGSPLISQITGNTFEEDAKRIEDIGRLCYPDILTKYKQNLDHLNRVFEETHNLFVLSEWNMMKKFDKRLTNEEANATTEFHQHHQKIQETEEEMEQIRTKMKQLEATIKNKDNRIQLMENTARMKDKKIQELKEQLKNIKEHQTPPSETCKEVRKEAREQEAARQQGFPEEAMKLLYYSNYVKFLERQLLNFEMVSIKMSSEVVANEDSIKKLQSEMSYIIEDFETKKAQYNKKIAYYSEKYYPKIVAWYNHPNRAKFRRSYPKFLEYLEISKDFEEYKTHQDVKDCLRGCKYLFMQTEIEGRLKNWEERTIKKVKEFEKNMHKNNELREQARQNTPQIPNALTTTHTKSYGTQSSRPQVSAKHPPIQRHFRGTADDFFYSPTEAEIDDERNESAHRRKYERSDRGKGGYKGSK